MPVVFLLVHQLDLLALTPRSPAPLVAEVAFAAGCDGEDITIGTATAVDASLRCVSYGLSR